MLICVSCNCILECVWISRLHYVSWHPSVDVWLWYVCICSELCFFMFHCHSCNKAFFRDCVQVVLNVISCCCFILCCALAVEPQFVFLNIILLVLRREEMTEILKVFTRQRIGNSASGNYTQQHCAFYTIKYIIKSLQTLQHVFRCLFYLGTTLKGPSNQ